MFAQIQSQIQLYRMSERHRQHLRAVHVQRGGVQRLRATDLGLGPESLVPDCQPDRFVPGLFHVRALR